MSYTLKGKMKGPPGADMSSTRNALWRAAEHLRTLWVSLAETMIGRETGSYVQHLKQDGAIEQDGFRVSIANTAPHAAAIEYGFQGFNLAQKIRWGSTPKAKMGKKGPYLIIPFRHAAFATPEKTKEQGLTRATRKRMMSEVVYKKAKRLVRHQNQESKGSRSLTRRQVQGISEQRAHWKAPKHAGLIKSGAPRHSQYITFRVITPKSTWNIPGRPGAFVAKKTATNGKARVMSMVGKAIKADITAWLAER